MTARPFYHPAVHDPSEPAPTYWRTTACLRGPTPSVEGDLAADLAVIGGGYTGLAAARRAMAAGQTVVVLEAGTPGWGASTRNAGFVCLGANALGATSMIRRHGLDAARAFYRHQIEAIETLVGCIGAEGIECDFVQGGSIEVAHRANRVGPMQADVEQARHVLGLPVGFLTRSELAETGFRGPEAYAAAHTRLGGGLHPAKLFDALLRRAVAAGVDYRSRSAVSRWQHDGDRHRLITATGSVRARRVVVATNGYGGEGLHPAMVRTVLPAISSILVTEPIPEDRFIEQGWTTLIPLSDSRILLHYFRRLPDGRVLLGSRGDLSGHPRAQSRMTARLTRRFGRLFPALADARVAFAWSGLIALSASLTPRIGVWPDDPSVAVAEAYHGNGVAFSHWAGQTAVELMLGLNRTAISPVVCGLECGFPRPDVRKPALAAAYLWFGLQDSL